VRRDTGERRQLPLAAASAAVDGLLGEVQAALFGAAREERERRTLRDPRDYAEMVEHLRDAAGFVVAPWCGSGDCEARVKEDSSATIRCLPLDEAPASAAACVCCGEPAVATAAWAQAY
jgi:prolyl-tRNA synthetase